jgi:hypothetical protein
MNIAHEVMPGVWEIEDFFDDFEQLKQSYRGNQTAWRAEYPNRLLTPWDQTPDLQSRMRALQPEIERIVSQALSPQVAYVSLDLSGCRIMMHRLHPDIRCFVQVCMADQEQPDLATHFCTDHAVNETHSQDYEDISCFRPEQLQAVSYRPNTAYVFLNQPRVFMGTRCVVPANTQRETFNLHFCSPLPAHAHP